eukprot:Rhum_TRINITY_DN14679_c26_g1::Rhum_TRINITY_DN14679_c26_g1_i1::g.110440::m.110440
MERGHGEGGKEGFRSFFHHMGRGGIGLCGACFGFPTHAIRTQKGARRGRVGLRHEGQHGGCVVGRGDMRETHKGSCCRYCFVAMCARGENHPFFCRCCFLFLPLLGGGGGGCNSLCVCFLSALLLRLLGLEILKLLLHLLQGLLGSLNLRLDGLHVLVRHQLVGAHLQVTALRGGLDLALPVRLHRHLLRQGVLALEPLRSRQRRLRRVRVRVEVGLELAGGGLARELEADGDAGVVLDLEEAGDLAVLDVEGKLGQHAQTLRRRARREAVQLRDRRVLVPELVVADVAVALARQVQHVRVLVDERHQHTRLRVNLLDVERRRHVVDVPHHQLTLQLLAETRGDDLVAVLGPQGALRLGSLVGNGLGDDVAAARVDDANLLVLRRGVDQAAVGVPVHGRDLVRVALELTALSLLDVPQLDGVVHGRGGEHVLSRRVPREDANLLVVSLVCHHRLLDVLRQAAVRDLPDLQRAVVGAGREQRLVVGVELPVDHSTLVAHKGRGVGRRLLRLGVVLHNNLTATARGPRKSNVPHVGINEVGAVPDLVHHLQVPEGEIRLEGGGTRVPVLGNLGETGHCCCCSVRCEGGGVRAMKYRYC